MLWLAIRTTALALDVAVRRGADRTQALAVCEGPEARPRIYQANAAALAAGIDAGLALAAARALLPALCVVPRDPAGEHAALERLAACAYALSGQVAPCPPDEVRLEIGASLKLFGDLARLLDNLRTAIALLDLSVVFGVAPTPLAASLAARGGIRQALLTATQAAQALPLLPLVHTPLPAELRARLAAAGLRCLRDLGRLPRSGLAQRYSATVTDYLDRLFGHAPDPQARWQPPPRFAARLELPGIAHSIEALRFPLRRLLQELVAFLHLRDGGIARFDLGFVHDTAIESTRLTLGLLSPTRSLPRLLELVESRLERLRLPGPVREIELHADELSELSAERRQLFADAHEVAPGILPPATRVLPYTSAALPLPQLLERLHARLGSTAVQALTPVADHRPERAQRLGAPQLSLPGANGKMDERSQRPVWLLSEPQAVAPDGLQCLSGPERIETGWWDEGDTCRDYFVACDAEGRRCWVYRERQAPQRWYLHGYFG